MLRSLQGCVHKILLFNCWQQGDALSVGSQNAAQKVLDGVTYISEAVACVGSPPTRLISSWVADQIAPKYWRPNHEIKVHNALLILSKLSHYQIYSCIMSSYGTHPTFYKQNLRGGGSQRGALLDKYL
jgi:hypothetical protein